jgi:hypothetical protein
MLNYKKTIDDETRQQHLSVGQFKLSQNGGLVVVVGKNTAQFSSAERGNDDSYSLPAAPSLRTRRVKQSSVPAWIASLRSQ